MKFMIGTRSFEFILFLSGYFFYRFQYGTENEFISFNLAIVQIAVSVYALFRYPVKINSLIYTASTFILLLFLQLVFYWQYIIPESGLPGDNEDYLSASIRLWVYLFFVCLYALTIRRNEIDEFCRAFIRLSRFSVLVAIATIILYYVSGVALLLNVYAVEHLVRPQAFLSEPSAFAPIAATLLIVGWMKKNVRDIFYSLVALLITFSPISIMTTLGAVFLYALLYGVKNFPLKLLIVVVVSIVVTYLLLADCASMVVSMNGFERTFGRMSCGVQVVFDSHLREQLQFTFTNQRLTSTFISIDLISEYKGLFSGFGLNSSSIFMPELFGEIRENSLWLSILLFYGVFGVFAFFAIIVAGLFCVKRASREFAVFYLAVLVASTINSAAGFYLYSLLFFAITVLLFGNDAKTAQMKMDRNNCSSIPGS